MKTIYYLYTITNLKNQKIYIGWTINPRRRWAKHISDSKHKRDNYAIHRAIRKYKEINFRFELIASCLSEKDAQETEKLLIKQYNTYTGIKGHNGYNMTEGGQGTVGSPRPKSKKWRREQSKKSSGVNNPMYGVKRSKRWSKLQSKRMKQYYIDNPEKVMSGEKNPMYGKSHSKESIRNCQLKKSDWKLTTPSGEIFVGKKFQIIEFLIKNNHNVKFGSLESGKIIKGYIMIKLPKPS